MDLVDLARRHGTPLYVYDAGTVRAALRAYRDAFAPFAPAIVAYSAKACALVGVLALLRGASVSAASVGELEAAAAAGIPPRRAWLHGNAKSEDELRAALGLGVGRVVLDGEAEIERLAGLVRRGAQAVWLRVSPGIAADTHAHLRTGALDQKFGAPIETGAAVALALRVLARRELRLVGLHAHVGSQIREPSTFSAVASALASLARELRSRGAPIRELCVGGGLGVPQTADEPAPDVAAYARAVATPIRAEADLAGVAIAVEPGRSMVNRAAVALYRVLDRKEVPGGRTFVSVDGGMGDNIRPSLYGARYDAVVADRASAPADERAAIAGAYCEAGDLLIADRLLPRARVGELVAIPSVGAYALAMASNYNHRPRPAVVLVDRDGPRLIRRRERTADLLRAEAPATTRRGGAAGRASRGG